jgi:hypothetical protein
MVVLSLMVNGQIERRRVQLEHRGIRDKLRLPAGDELRQQRERAGLGDDPGGGEHDVFGVLGGHVRDFAVERLALVVERAELPLVARERPAAPANPPPRRVRVDVEEDRQRMLAERAADPGRLDRAAPEGQHSRALVLQRRECRLRLEDAELDLAALLEQLRDRLSGCALELPVEVDEPAAEPRRDLRAERRLARAHESDESDVPV